MERVGLDYVQLGDKQIKQVKVLLDTETLKERELKIEKLRKQKQDREDEELTLQPKTNKKMNELYA